MDSWLQHYCTLPYPVTRPCHLLIVNYSDFDATLFLMLIVSFWHTCILPLTQVYVGLQILHFLCNSAHLGPIDVYQCGVGLSDTRPSGLVDITLFFCLFRYSITTVYIMCFIWQLSHLLRILLLIQLNIGLLILLILWNSSHTYCHRPIPMCSRPITYQADITLFFNLCCYTLCVLSPFAERKCQTHSSHIATCFSNVNNHLLLYSAGKARRAERRNRTYTYVIVYNDLSVLRRLHEARRAKIIMLWIWGPKGRDAIERILT